MVFPSPPTRPPGNNSLSPGPILNPYGAYGWTPSPNIPPVNTFLVPAPTGNAAQDMGIYNETLQLASSEGGGVVLLQGPSKYSNYYAAATSSHQDSGVSVGANSNVWTDPSATSSYIGQYVLGAYNSCPLKITGLLKNPVGFTTDNPAINAIVSGTVTIANLGFVIPFGVDVKGGGRFISANFLSTPNPSSNTLILDSGNGITGMFQGSPVQFASGNTGFGGDWSISDLSIRGSLTGTPGATLASLLIPNGAWFATCHRVDCSWNAIAGIINDDNQNQVLLDRCSIQSNGTAAATVPTGGLLTSYFNGVTSGGFVLDTCLVNSNYGMGVGSFNPLVGVGATATVLRDTQIVFTGGTAWSGSFANGFGLVIASNANGLSYVVGGYIGPAGPGGSGDIWVDNGNVTFTGVTTTTPSTGQQIALQGSSISNFIGHIASKSSGVIIAAATGAVTNWVGDKVLGGAAWFTGGPTAASLAGMGTHTF